MSNSRVLELMKGMGREQRPRVNPYASHAAAEILALEGKHKEAAEVRSLVDPTNEQFAQDPLDFWLAVEELGPPTDD